MGGPALRVANHLHQEDVGPGQVSEGAGMFLLLLLVIRHNVVVFFGSYFILEFCFLLLELPEPDLMLLSSPNL